MKQIGLGWLQYAQDYDEKVMPVSTSGAGRTYYWWASWDGTTLRENEGLLQPYMKNAQIQACPSFANSARAALGLTGYGYNYGFLSPFPAPDYKVTPAALASIGNVAETVVFADGARINFSDKKTVEGNTYIDKPSSNYPGFHARHNGTGNVLWADGHVKAMKPIYRDNPGGGGYAVEVFRSNGLGDLDKDGDLSTNEYFDLE